jgi:hypothetical protein
MLVTEPRLAPRAARTAIGLIALAPAAGLYVQPAGSALAPIALAAGVLACWHGLGRLVGWLAGDDDAPVGLVLAWGVALHLALSGCLLAIEQLGTAARTVLATGGVGAGALWAMRRASRLAGAPLPRPTWAAAVPWLVAAALATVFVLGAAGAWSAPFLDEETGALGQLRRLADTGALGDAVGFPRAVGLGGHLALSALAAPLGDLRAAHLVDRGLLFAVVLAGLAGSRPVAGASIGTLLVMLAAAAIPDYGADMAPRWALIALVLGAGATLARARRRRSPRLLVTAILMAAALVTIRHAGVGALVVIAAAALGEPLTTGRRRLAVVAAAVVAFTVGPYLIAAVRADGDGIGWRLLAQGVAPRIAIAAAVAAGLALLGGLAIPASRDDDARSQRTTLTAIAASIAAAGLFSLAGSAWQLMVTLATGWVIAVAAHAAATPVDDDAADGDRPGARPSWPLIVIAVTALTGGLAMARFAAGRPGLTWPRRMAVLLADARALGRAVPAGAEAREHAVTMADVAADARVALWLDRPDLVDHRQRDIVDLRTAPALRCARAPRGALCRDLDQVLARRDLLVVAVTTVDPELAACDRSPDAACSVLQRALAAALGAGSAIAIVDLRALR